MSKCEPGTCVDCDREYGPARGVKQQADSIESDRTQRALGGRLDTHLQFHQKLCDRLDAALKRIEELEQVVVDCITRLEELERR